MGLLSNLLGNATEIDPVELEKDFGGVIFENETIEAAFKIFRDKWIFTNKRLIMLDVQGLTGSKKEYHSLPYKSITHFLVETTGSFDLDCELEIWVSGHTKSFKKQLRKGVDVIKLQRTLALHICK